MKPLFNQKNFLFHLSLVAFVFIVSVGLSLIRQPSKLQVIKREIKDEKGYPPSRNTSGVSPRVKAKSFSLWRDYAPDEAQGEDTPTVRLRELHPALPVLSGNSNFPVVSAQAALAVDLDSMVTLYEKDPDKALFPASTTKIVTALVAMDYFSGDSILEVGRIKVDGQKMGLRTGEKISVSNLLYGLLVYSANDAAEVLAMNCAGGRDGFIAAMNRKAEELNLENSHFANPSGLDGNGNKIVTTARDLVRISIVAMQNPKFAEIVKTKEITVANSNGTILHKLSNINELVGKVDGVLGVKTGWTENARENLVTYIERDGHKVMIALLGSQDRFGETKELIDWIFKNYNWQEVKVPD